MDFMQSQTALNLARSFAGESQARNRYTIYAAQARKEEQEYLARILEETAANELAHAQEFFEQLQRYGAQPIQNLTFEAGYPYNTGTTVENFAYAAEGEKSEHERVYPDFARIASEEGFDQIARLWTLIASVEGTHNLVFDEAHRALSAGTLYERQSPTVWRCLNCGYAVSSKAPWKVCPICGKPIGWVQGDVKTRVVAG